MAIREKKRPEDPIEWNDLKPMKFTRAVRIFVGSFFFFFFLRQVIVNE